MLKQRGKTSRRFRGGSFVIIASRYNAKYVDAMVKAAQAELNRAKAKTVKLIRVPGAFEIPLAAARIARRASKNESLPWATAESNSTAPDKTIPVDAIICLGIILRGETVHAAHIGEAVTRALMDIQVKYEVPIIHEVLLLENESQANARCLDQKHNRGIEAARTALEIANPG